MSWSLQNLSRGRYAGFTRCHRGAFLSWFSVILFRCSVLNIIWYICSVKRIFVQVKFGQVKFAVAYHHAPIISLKPRWFACQHSWAIESEFCFMLLFALAKIRRGVLQTA